MNNQEKIIKAGRNLFTEYGYKKVSVEEIAQTSGLTKKTIYAYFKDKEDLFNYFIKEEIAKIKIKAEEIDQLDMNFFDKFHKMLYEMLKYRKNQKLILSLSREVALSNSITAKTYLKKIDKEIVDFVTNKLEQAILKKQIRQCDAKIVSYLLVGSYLRLIYNYDDFDLDIDEYNLLKELSLLITDGLKSRGN